jgi:hypothetical protein
MMRMNGRLFLRPGNMLKDFEVCRRSGKFTADGRVRSEFTKTGDIIRGVLSDASTEEEFRWSQNQHPITHKIVQKGTAKAKAGDELMHDERVFLVQGVDDVSELGMVTIYYIQERSDVD